MRNRALIAFALVLAVSALPSAPAEAAGRTVIGVLRQVPGTLSDVVVQEANRIIWQRLSGLAGPGAVSEAQLASQMQGAYASFQGCTQDGCMQQLGYLAGAERVVWGYVQRTPSAGFRVHLRTVAVNTSELLGSVDSECRACTDAEVLGQLMAFDPSPLRLAPAAPGFAQPQQAPPVAPQPPPQAPPQQVMPPQVAPAAVTGRLSILSKPSGADVLVNQQKVGVTPMKDIELPPGTHSFTIVREGYLAEPVTAQVLAGRLNEVVVGLRASQIKVSIRSTPTGAQVSVNGQPVGKTPMVDVPVAIGSYDVGLVLDGYQPQRRQVVLDGTEATTEVKFQLEAAAPTEGTLTVATKPDGASLMVNGQPSGVAPQSLKLAPGAVEIVAALAGYVTARQQAEIVAGKTAKLTMTLTKEPPATGTAKVSSTPKGASLFLDNQPVGTAPATITAGRGSHQLRWELEGFSPVEKTVEVQGGGRHTFDAQLSKAPPAPGTGTVKIAVEPKGAVVSLNGRDFPPGNVGEQVLMAGSYPVVIKAEGYQPLEFQLEVKDQQAQEIRRALAKLPAAPAPGLLTITTTPKGANVQANGVDIGVTPVRNYKLDPGFYTLGIYLDGYAAVEQEVEVGSRKKVNIDQKLKSLYATLKVTSKPKGATVFLQDQEMGTTPGTFGKLKGGTYKILVAKEGSKEVLGEVTLEEGKVTEVSYDIEEQPGFLTLRVQPRQANVFVDGKPIGVGAIRKHPLTPGTHEVVAKFDGYKDAVGTVTIEKGKEKSLGFDMEELPKQAPVAPPTEEDPDAGVDAGTPDADAADSETPAAAEPGATTPPAAEEAKSEPAAAAPDAPPAAAEDKPAEPTTPPDAAAPNP